jgi:hypothetical protein
MKERPILFSAPMVRALLDGSKTQTRRVIADRHLLGGPPTDALLEMCPYGQPGDRLWVREAWTTHACFDDIPPRDLTTRSLHYQADGLIKTGKNRPSMFMPRWASRITLEITDMRVERLQDISEADAKAEGLTCQNGLYATPGQVWQIDPRKAYRDLWESINGPVANPWVWVIEFKRVTP